MLEIASEQALRTDDRSIDRPKPQSMSRAAECACLPALAFSSSIPFSRSATAEMVRTPSSTHSLGTRQPNRQSGASARWLRPPVASNGLLAYGEGSSKRFANLLVVPHPVKPGFRAPTPKRRAQTTYQVPRIVANPSARFRVRAETRQLRLDHDEVSLRFLPAPQHDVAVVQEILGRRCVRSPSSCMSLT